MQRILKLSAVVFALALSLLPARARDFGTGSLPIAVEPDRPIAIETPGTIQIDGVNTSAKPITIVLRIDDGQSTNYTTRMNDERVHPPGPFKLSYDTATLRAANGRPLNAADIRRIILFVNGEGTARVTKFHSAANPGTAAAPAIAAATTTDFGSGDMPIAVEPDKPIRLPTDGLLRVEGLNTGTAPINIVLRIDDGTSIDYMSRMNDERVTLPGPFSHQYDLANLRATNGRTLDPSTITRLILFINGPGAAKVTQFSATGNASSQKTVVKKLDAPAEAATARDLGKGSFPIAFEPDQPVQLNPAHEILLEGTIDTASPATVVLRIDDEQSANYTTRMNDERQVTPGPFALRFDVASLKATNGRSLDANRITRVIAFINGEGTGTIRRFTIGEKNALAAATTLPAQNAKATAVVGDARGLGTGPLPIAFEPNQPISLSPDHEIRLEGTVSGPQAATVVLRVDDINSTNYQNRVNLERNIKAGPFAFRTDVSALRTSEGKTIDPKAITRIIAFVNGSGSATVTRFDVGPKGGAPIHAEATRAPAAVASRPAAKAAGSLNFGTGSLPIKFDPSAAVAFDDADEVRVEGVVDGKTPAAVALRIDDGESSGYPARYNDERTLPPGPFKLRIGLKGLKTPSGRILDHRDIRRIHLFAWQGTPTVRIIKFETGRGATLPSGSAGYALGAENAPLHPGFERIAPGDQRITARGTAEAIRRTAPDPLVANGLRGIRTLTLTAPKGRHRVTVWSEDPGEWEDLPREFERRIRINGKDALVHKMSADTWVTERYLRGAKIEHSTSDDAWTAYGRHRGNRRWVDVDAVDGRIVIELTGTEASAYYLSAVLVEPAPTQTTAVDAPGQALVEQQRAEWYRSNFPVTEFAIGKDDGGFPVHLNWSDATQTYAPISIKAAPDTGAGLRLDVTSSATLENPRITLEAPRFNTTVLPADIWAAERRLERDATVLKLTDHRLIANTATRPLSTIQGRSYEVWIDVPKGAAAAKYSGAVVIENSGQKRRIPIAVEVLPVALPAAAKPAGFYLARAPHLTYFTGLAVARDQQVTCDLDVMRRLGLANTAPPIAGLDRTDLSSFGADMRRSIAAGVTPGWLIYNPLYELHRKFGAERAADIVGRLETVIKASDLPKPLWSIADEPSNPDQNPGDLEQWAKALRRTTPGIQLAGHLNAPKDDRFAPLFDTLIINEGFGIDPATITRHVKFGKRVWFYNTFAPRVTAGHWLWSTDAERYVQWHARMPTADPFDPIDGREADFQVIYPTATVCPKTPDIHRDLLRLAEGVIDQRWLLWLERQTAPDAKALTAELRTVFAKSFDRAKAATRKDLNAIRERIMALAAPK